MPARKLHEQNQTKIIMDLVTIFGPLDYRLKRRKILSKEAFDSDQIKDEAEIIEAAKSDLSYFEILYNKYYESIFRYVYRQTGDEDETADIVSKVFLNAIKALDKYEHRGFSFGAWLFRIASNETNKFFRGNKKRVLSLEEQRLNLVMECEPFEDNSDRIGLLNTLIQELDDDEIKILELKFFEEKNFKEIAFVLNKNESTIKMRMYRALNKLKERYEQIAAQQPSSKGGIND